MRITFIRINYPSQVKAIRKRELKNRKLKNFKTTSMNTWAMDAIEYVNNKMRRYMLITIDLDTRIAYAVALSSKR
ncbi:TPA: hypothetical protein ACV1MF_001434 [Campylobacter jejuni]